MKNPKKSPTPSLVPSPAASYKARVETAYAEVNRRGGEFMRSVCAFGALLDEVAAFLGESRGRPSEKSSAAAEHFGDGLQNWLVENCPEVNYKTAMGYKALAGKAAKMIGGGTQAIAALQGRDTVAAPGTGEVIDVDAEIIEKREALFAEVDSRRKLEQLYFEFSAGKGHAGRPKGSGSAAAAPLSKVESARRLWANLIYQAVKFRAGLYSAAKLLPREDAESSYGELKALVDALKSRLGEKD